MRARDSFQDLGRTEGSSDQDDEDGEVGHRRARDAFDDLDDQDDGDDDSASSLSSTGGRSTTPGLPTVDEPTEASTNTSTSQTSSRGGSGGSRGRHVDDEPEDVEVEEDTSDSGGIFGSNGQEDVVDEPTGDGSADRPQRAREAFAQLRERENDETAVEDGTRDVSPRRSREAFAEFRSGPTESEQLDGLEEDDERVEQIDDQWRFEEGDTAADIITTESQRLQDQGIRRDEFAFRFDEDDGLFVEFAEDSIRRRRRQEAREEAADGTPFRADDFEISTSEDAGDQIVLSDSARDIRIEQLTQQQIDEALEDIDGQTEGFDVSRDDIVVDDETVRLSEEAEREFAAAQLDAEFEDIDVEPEDLEQTDDGFVIDVPQDRAPVSERFGALIDTARQDGILVDDVTEARPTSTEFNIVRDEFAITRRDAERAVRDVSRGAFDTAVDVGSRGVEMATAPVPGTEDARTGTPPAVGPGSIGRVPGAARDLAATAGITVGAIGVSEIDAPAQGARDRRAVEEAGSPVSTTIVEIPESGEAVSTTRVEVPESRELTPTQIETPERRESTTPTELEVPEDSEPATPTELGVPDETTQADPSEIQAQELIQPRQIVEEEEEVEELIIVPEQIDESESFDDLLREELARREESEQVTAIEDATVPERAVEDTELPSQEEVVESDITQFQEEQLQEEVQFQQVLQRDSPVEQRIRTGVDTDVGVSEIPALDTRSEVDVATEVATETETVTDLRTPTVMDTPTEFATPAQPMATEFASPSEFAFPNEFVTARGGRARAPRTQIGRLNIPEIEPPGTTPSEPGANRFDFWSRERVSPVDPDPVGGIQDFLGGVDRRERPGRTIPDGINFDGPNIDL